MLKIHGLNFTSHLRFGNATTELMVREQYDDFFDPKTHVDIFVTGPEKDEYEQALKAVHEAIVARGRDGKLPNNDPAVVALNALKERLAKKALGTN